MGEVLVKLILKIVFFAILIAIGWIYGTNHPAPDAVTKHATKLVQMVKEDYKPNPKIVEKTVEVVKEVVVEKEVMIECDTIGMEDVAGDMSDVIDAVEEMADEVSETVDSE